jgi:hypothetical protein
MESTTNSSRCDYQINFFKPKSIFLKDNVCTIVISFAIWAVAVFCFHILLYKILPAL